jgi:hypothetical protein
MSYGLKSRKVLPGHSKAVVTLVGVLDDLDKRVEISSNQRGRVPSPCTRFPGVCATELREDTPRQGWALA